MTLISNLTQLTGHYVPRINQLTQEPLEPWLDVAFARKWLTTGWEESLPSISLFGNVSNDGHCIDWQNPVLGISRKTTTVLSSWWPNRWTLRGAEPTPSTSLPLTTCLVAALPSGSTAKLWYVVRPSWLFFCNLPCSPLLQCTGVYFEHNVSDKFFTLEIRFVVVVHLTK